MKERTLSIIKPDAVERNLSGAINAMIQSKGIKIVAQRMMKLSSDQARQFYDVHKDRSFFDDLVAYMCSGPVVIQVLEAENVVARYRALMGATNPASAEEGTIRKVHGLSVDKNAVHGSDSLENAAREIAYFFARIDMF